MKRNTDIFKKIEFMDTSIAEEEEMFYTPKIRQLEKDQRNLSVSANCQEA